MTRPEPGNIGFFLVIFQDLLYISCIIFRCDLDPAVLPSGAPVFSLVMFMNNKVEMQLILINNGADEGTRTPTP